MLPKIVAVLPIRNLNDLDKIENYLDADFIELRLDYLNSIKELNLNYIMKYKDKLILTIRDVTEGGKNRIDDIEKMNFINKAIERGFLCDIEAKFIERYKVTYRDMIVSAHYLEELPTMEQIVSLIDNYAKFAKYIKIAVINKKGYRELLSKALELSDNIVVMPLNSNPLERIAFSILGSKLIYGFIEEPVAKGQLHYKKIREILEILFKF
jgi:3-dehydroquinate dehydratase-1